MKLILGFILLLGILAACGGDSSTYIKSQPCTVFYSDNGQILIKCPDGTEVDVTPIDGIDGIDGEDCSVEETDDSYNITCPGSELEIPKFDEDEESHGHSMRCKKRSKKKFKCNKESRHER